MELVTVKLIVLAISGLVRILFGVIPVVVVRLLSRSWSKGMDKRMKTVISFLMFFGGGVLLATCFLHMMPEVRDNFRRSEPELELPLSEIIFVAGFFIVYMIEDIVHSIIHQRRSRKEANKLQSQNNKSDSKKFCDTDANSNPSSRTMTVVERGFQSGLHNADEAITIPTSNHSATCSATNNSNSLSLFRPSSKTEDSHNPNLNRGTNEMFKRNIPDEIPGISRSPIYNGMGGFTNEAFVHEKFQYCDPDWLMDMVQNGGLERQGRGRTSICKELILSNASPGGRNRSNSVPNNTHHNGLAKNDLKSENCNNAGSPHSKKTHHHNHGHSHLPMDNDIDQTMGAEIRNLLIVIAISFHGVFEGMAIGLQGSEADVWYLFLAVSLHECTILFCIGVELISSKTKLYRMILYILVVSLVSPIGIAIGIVISEKQFGEVIHQALIVGCFQGLAAGTLLYVTFFEIFQEEGKKLHRKCYHILVAVIGFVLMGSLEFMGGHNHGEEGHGGNGEHDHDHEFHKKPNNNSHTHSDHDGHDHHH